MIVRAYGLGLMDKGGINDIWKIFPVFESMTMNPYAWFHYCEFHFICRSFNLDDYSVYCDGAAFTHSTFLMCVREII